MKLAEGMYVRTKYGISQYKQHKVIGSEDIKGILCKDGSRVIFANIEDVIGEPSFEIIDLIQEGDYVNGTKVGHIDDCKGAMREFYYETENPANVCGYWNEEIETVVTREQFEAMQYKVVE